MKRVAFAVAGLALVIGVVLLRDTDNTSAPTAPPPPTKLKAFAADQVLVPSPQGRPAKPGAVTARPGNHRVQLTWTGEAPAYEVRWGERTKLVTRPGTQLNGLRNEQEQQIEVRAVDSFGQYSEPAVTKATPRADNAPYSFVDRFDGNEVPDQRLWRFGKRTDCARATSGDGDDHDRLVIGTSCGTRAVSLRARTPFVRGADESRFVVEADAPGTGGKLLLDLVPGPVSVQGDPVLPTAVRATISTDAAGNSVAELVPDGVVTRPIPAAVPGMTVRWELVLGSGGIQLHRDGEVVATSPFVPQWREATALVGVAALAGDRLRAGIDLIGFRAGAAEAPPNVPPPAVRVDAAPSATTPLPNVTAGQLRLALIPSREGPPVDRVKVNGVEVPLRPAVEGQAWKPGAEYPAVADLPAEAFTDSLDVQLATAERVQVTHTDVELTSRTSGISKSDPGTPLVDARPSLADPVAEVLDSGGQPVPNGAALTRGRVVLEIRISALDAAVAGLAGFEVRLDGNHIATVPTTADGPAGAGRWRISLNTGSMVEGPHAIEVRAFSTDPEAHPETGYVPFLLKP
ncbi:hypothetical protein [Nocardia sp. NRRL S-836]|uniref:hypothetical protein n=1 Tax=Nocardia sp. NRRL S-836 TaxID=1519492 RepID=UPI0006AE5ADF|nr:hypothetical protein [Nocardia sp. NRRL S-836]KOV79415.1 hypothetical protein ADL03_36945 [Nocardia sp. NRRL S-836]